MVYIENTPDSGLRKVSFIFVAEPGQKVFLAGSFNDWEQEKLPMLYDEKNHAYTAAVMLGCGNYEYKFVVNGEWITDPDNQNFSANDFGTLNSVITIG